MGSMDKKKALSILELHEDFTAEELIQVYRKKLFQIHPDTSLEVETEISIDDLIASRKFLEEFLTQKKEVPQKAQKTKDDGYMDYREGMVILGAALDSYWKKRIHYSQRPEDAEFVKKFHDDLNRAKDRFAAVLIQHPGGLWTPDAVEEIARINDWLGVENDSR